VQVGLPRAKVAEEQMTAEEKQRVLGIIPDFYVSYVPNAASLDFTQNFNPAWKATSDPFTFVLAGAIAGIQQSQNYFKGYGQGFKGYAKRYGANYANTVTANFIRRCDTAFAFEAGPALFLQGNGHHTIADSLCACQCSRLQRRQWTLATKLLPSPRVTSQRRGFRTFTILPVIAMVRR
jgi:hypothetical protein